MWGRRRKELDDRLARIERALETLSQPRSEPAGANTDTIAKLLGTMMTTNVDLVGSMGDLAVRSVARRNGIRGGTSNARTATRDRDGKFLPRERRARRPAQDEPRCPLCIDPHYANVTIPMVQAHRQHEAARNARMETGYDRTDTDESAQSDPGESTGADYANGAGAAVH